MQPLFQSLHNPAQMCKGYIAISFVCLNVVCCQGFILDFSLVGGEARPNLMIKHCYIWGVGSI